MTTTEPRRVPIAADVVEASAQFMAVAERLPTLYQLAAEWSALFGLLEEPDQDHEAIDAELERVASDIQAKAYGLAVVIQGIENKNAMLKLEEQRLYAKRKAGEAAADRIRAYTLSHFKELGIERLDYGAFTLSVRTNPAAVNVLDAAAVPSEFTKTTITVSVDKRGILEHLKATGEIPEGVEITRGERLSIA